MKKQFIAAISLLLVSMNSFSQNGESSETSFKPYGTPLVTIFSDFRYNVQDGNSNPAFELSRSYFGYVYHFTSGFSSKVELDVTTANNSAGTFPSAYTAYLKNAYGEFSNKIIKVDFGLIGTSAFNLQESTWGKRYLLKSFQDLNGFSSSADLGVSVSVKVAPQLSIDAQVLNGEGYKKVQADSTIKIAAGVTYEPIKHLFVRVYGDYLKGDNTSNKADQSTINAFIGYKGADFTLAGEYNYQKGHGNVKDHNLSGLSIYGTYKASKLISAFARYDYLTSNKPSGESSHWNETASGDNCLYAVGVEFFPAKGIAISPNVQVKDPKLASAKTTTSFLVNLNLSF